MTLNERVERFIEEHIKDIDDNNFIACYNDLWWNVSGHDMVPADIGLFTCAMQEADINILDYLTKIPECCYCLTDFTGHYLPSWIETIAGLAFAESNIEEIDCGKGMQRIESFAFKNCAALDTVIIHPHPMLVIEGKAFTGCSNLTNITFKGTKQEWYKTQKYDSWLAESAIKYVDCTDGTIQVKKGIKP